MLKYWGVLAFVITNHAIYYKKGELFKRTIERKSVAEYIVSYEFEIIL